MPDLNFKQTQKQIQTLKLSQLQLQTLSFIQESNIELRETIYSKVEENPALEIVSDSFSEGLKKVSIKNQRSAIIDPRSGIKSVDRRKASTEASDAYQAMLESTEDTRETLQTHLQNQVNALNLSEREKKLCTLLIGNLDSKGHHYLAPASLLETDDFKPFSENLSEKEKEVLLEECIKKIQHLEPAGTCCKDVQESLEVQARLCKNIPPLAMFFLHGNLELIAQSSIDSIFRKLSEIQKKNEKLSLRNSDQKENEFNLNPEDITKENIEDAVSFIKTLDPFPARDYGNGSEVQYIQPEVSVTRHIGTIEKDDFEKGLVLDSENSFFAITGINSTLPELRLSSDFVQIKKEDCKSDQEKEFAKKAEDNVKDAKAFIDSLNFRQTAIISSISCLVRQQIDFFRNGPGNLKPLTRRELSKILNIHESTVSRIADSKFIRTDWGVLPVKYFFTSGVNQDRHEDLEKTASIEPLAEISKVSKNASSAKNVAATTSQVQNQVVSSEKIKLEIQKLLASQKPGEKPLSDQKISDALSALGIQVARRTVSKYRKQLSIQSSYTR